MNKCLLLCLLPITFLACANIQTIPTSEIKIAKEVNTEPILASEVIIYRSVLPDNINEYQEIGVVVLRGDNPEIDKIFNLIRDEAAKQGAVYVVDFKLKCNPEMRSTVVTNINPDGGMTTSIITYEVIAYTATGTLLSRRK